MGLDISDKMVTIGFILGFVVAEKNVYLIAVRRTLGMKGQRPETPLCWHPKCLALPLLFLNLFCNQNKGIDFPQSFFWLSMGLCYLWAKEAF